MYMYEFSDAIDKVNFDEEFSDVADNIKNDCWQLESMNFSDAVAKINEWIDRVFNPCKCSIIDYPEWFKIVVWRVLYNELKANPQARQTELIENNINLPKDVFGKKYWNMYSPDMKLQQEKYDNLFLPFNYAQVECNPIYRAMIHHIICSADICTDSIVDVFGKFGLVPALCANGYKHKVVCVSEKDYFLFSVLQDALKKPVKVYKIIGKLQHYLEIKNVDKELKLIQEQTLNELGQIKLIMNNKIEKIQEIGEENTVRYQSYAGIKYTKEQMAAYIFVNLCFSPEYWVDSNLEIVGNKVTGWIDETKTFTRRAEEFIKLSKEEFVQFANEFRKLDFHKCSIDDIKKSLREDYFFYAKDSDDFDEALLYVDAPKYIREYKRFNMSGTWMRILLDTLNNHRGNWILTWSTYVEKGVDGETLFDKLYTGQRMEAEEQFTLRDDIPIKEKVSISTLYQLVDVINASRKLYVFLYRESNRNKQQNIAFITDIDFDNITNDDFGKKYNIEFTHHGRLIKMDWTDFRTKYKKN